MKLHWLTAVLIAVLFWTGLQAAPQAGKDAIATKLVALANEWTQAINKKDRRKLDELMAPEFALYAWDGRLLGSRQVWLDNLFSRITIEKNTLTDISPRVYAEFAVITSKSDWVGSLDGRHFDKRCVVVDTFRMHGGQWRVVTRTSDCTDN